MLLPRPDEDLVSLTYQDRIKASVAIRTPAGVGGQPRPKERACSVARTINILSDAWTFLILREAFFGTRNFEAFRTALDIPRATLANRLSRLSEQGIFRRAAASKTSRREEYRLTKKGFDLYPTFVALMQFGDRWLSGGETVPLELVHDCGCISRPIVGCSSCLTELQTREVTYRDGPGARQEVTRTGRSARRSSDDGKFARGRPSSVARALQIIGDRWSFMVVREAFFGIRRYDQMQMRLNIAPNILTDRLSRFVERGVFERRLYQEAPPRFEYVLTDMGRDLYGPFLAMMAWGNRWLSAGERPLILTHRRCGNEFEPTVICDHCREPIHAGSMKYRLSYDPNEFRASVPDQLV